MFEGKTLDKAVRALSKDYGKGDNEQEGRYELMRANLEGHDR